jgi:hypothetical protein
LFWAITGIDSTSPTRHHRLDIIDSTSPTRHHRLDIVITFTIVIIFTIIFTSPSSSTTLVCHR